MVTFVYNILIMDIFKYLYCPNYGPNLSTKKKVYINKSNFIFKDFKLIEKCNNYILLKIIIIFYHFFNKLILNIFSNIFYCPN